MEKKKVSKIKIGDDLKSGVKKAVDELGGFGKFIKPGDVVLLKPNFNSADPYPASSDPVFLRAVVDLVYDSGAKLAIVVDSSMYALNTRKVMEKLKIFDLQNTKRPPRVYVFDEMKWVKKEIPAGKFLKSVSVPELLDSVDKLILLPCLKTHFKAHFTGALKLSVGFMKPFQRVGLHLKNLEEKIAELNKVINPDLVIMDARECFITGGPANGEKRSPGIIMASESRANIDIEGVKIIQGFNGNSLEGVDPMGITHIRMAKEFGM